MSEDHTKCGRPIAYTAEIGEEIFDRLVEGQGVCAICADAHMPTEQRLRLWLSDEPFLKICGDAFQMRVDEVADQFFELVCGVPRPHPIEVVRGRGVRIDDADNPDLARVRFDLRMYLMRLLLAKDPA
jgi:hypothetical protein